MSETLRHGFIEIPADADSHWWWEALADERLLVPLCGTCGRHFFPPQPTCPYCGSDNWSRAESSGKATVYSWVVVHIPLHAAFKDDAPYTIVAADLVEGVRIYGRLQGESSGLAAAAPLRATFYDVGGKTLLGFELTRE